MRMNMPQRLASLTRFREKRKERCYDKKIRYTVRKEVAQRCSLFLLCIVNLQIVESLLLKHNVLLLGHALEICKVIWILIWCTPCKLPKSIWQTSSA